MSDETWANTATRLGVPGSRRRDPGIGRVLLSAAVVGILWAQGGVLKTFAGVILLAAVAMPGPDGKSLLQLTSEGLRSLLEVWT